MDLLFLAWAPWIHFPSCPCSELESAPFYPGFAPMWSKLFSVHWAQSPWFSCSRVAGLSEKSYVDSISILKFWTDYYSAPVSIAPVVKLVGHSMASHRGPHVWWSKFQVYWMLKGPTVEHFNSPSQPLRLNWELFSISSALLSASTVIQVEKWRFFQCKFQVFPRNFRLHSAQLVVTFDKEDVAFLVIYKINLRGFPTKNQQIISKGNRPASPPWRSTIEVHKL